MRRRPYKKLQERTEEMLYLVQDSEAECQDLDTKNSWRKFRTARRKFNAQIDKLVEILTHNLTLELSNDKFYDLYSFGVGALRRDRAILGHLAESNLSLNDIKKILKERFLMLSFNELLTLNIIIKDYVINFVAGEDYLAVAFQIVETGELDDLIYPLFPPQDLVTVSNSPRYYGLLGKDKKPIEGN